MKRLLGKSEQGMFATRTVTGHLLRGCAAFLLLYVAVSQQPVRLGLSLLCAVLALVLMRGCPACWATGLVETIRQRSSKRIEVERGRAGA